MGRTYRGLAWTALAAGIALASCGGDGAVAGIRLATTTSARDTGLLDVLLPAFRADTGVEVLPIAVGTGEALKLGERGDADVVLVHSRKAEDEFVARGLGVERRDVWWNRFVLVGPPSDPAGVRGTASAAEALATIRAKGARFVSRGDESGTHQREKALWAAAGSFARWDEYLETGQGMGATLTVADEKRAYALTDEGTLLRVRRRLGLEALVAGDPALENPYGAILVRPGKDAARHESAARFVRWLTSERARALVRGLRVDGARPFFLMDERGMDERGVDERGPGEPAPGGRPEPRARAGERQDRTDRGFFGEGVAEAARLLTRGDAETWHAIALSLWTSLLAVAAGALLGAPAGAAIAVFRPRGTGLLVLLLRVAMSIPTVVIGLVLYGLLSRRGPLAPLDLLYTPAAIVLGEVALAFPIVAAFTHAGVSALDRTAVETVRSHGGGAWATLGKALSETRGSLVAALLAAFGRCITELGVALAVGGNLALRTRTVPAQISLETSKGEFGRALAPGLVLVLLAVVAALAASALGRERRS